jgi:hypothetical protein
MPVAFLESEVEFRGRLTQAMLADEHEAVQSRRRLASQMHGMLVRKDDHAVEIANKPVALFSDLCIATESGREGEDCQILLRGMSPLRIHPLGMKDRNKVSDHLGHR